MRDVDDRALREVLRRVVETYPGSHRELEDRLHIGHGNINKLYGTRMKITVVHLLRFAEVFGVPVEDFLALAYAEQRGLAKRRLVDLLAPQEPQRAAEAAAAAAAARREELAEVVRMVVREELDRRAVEAPPERAERRKPNGRGTATN